MPLAKAILCDLSKKETTILNRRLSFFIYFFAFIFLLFLFSQIVVYEERSALFLKPTPIFNPRIALQCGGYLLL